MTTYHEFCRLRDLHTPGANAPKHTEADAFFMAAAQLAVPDGYKLVPLEPTPAIIASAAVAIWPTASPADIALARLAAPIVLMRMDMAAGTTVDAVAGMLATMAPAYRAMLAAAPIAPAEVNPAPKNSTPIEKTRANFEDWYTTHAADIKAAPIGSRDSMLQWSSWLAADSENYIARADWKVSPLPWGPTGQLEQDTVTSDLRYPATMTTALADVLSLPNFRTGPITHVYRAAGAEIRTKCEDEQAFVLDRFLRLALEHGDGWRTAAEADLKAAHTLAEANKAGES